MKKKKKKNPKLLPSTGGTINAFVWKLGRRSSAHSLQCGPLIPESDFYVAYVEVVYRASPPPHLCLWATHLVFLSRISLYFKNLRWRLNVQQTEMMSVWLLKDVYTASYSTHAPLNRDNGGLLPDYDAYLHFVNKNKRSYISDCRLPGPFSDYSTGNSNTLLIIHLATIYLHNLFTTNHITCLTATLSIDQANSSPWFMNFQLTKLSLDSEDGFRKGCRNVSHKQQSFSGLQSPRWSSIKVLRL